MNERIRQLFEEHTVPNFGLFDRNVGHLNLKGEYDNPVLEDHWQTFQEAAELIVKECARVYWRIDDGEIHGEYVNALKKHFGIKK